MSNKPGEIWKYFCEFCQKWVEVGDHDFNPGMNPATGVAGFPVCPQCGTWLDYREWNELPDDEIANHEVEGR